MQVEVSKRFSRKDTDQYNFCINATNFILSSAISCGLCFFIFLKSFTPPIKCRFILKELKLTVCYRRDVVLSKVYKA